MKFSQRTNLYENKSKILIQENVLFLCLHYYPRNESRGSIAAETQEASFWNMLRQ